MMDDDLYPEYERAHDLLSEDCWCHPYLYYEAPNGNRIYIHRDSDDLEEDMPPGDALMEAVVMVNFGIEEEEETPHDS